MCDHMITKPEVCDTKMDDQIISLKNKLHSTVYGHDIVNVIDEY